MIAEPEIAVKQRHVFPDCNSNSEYMDQPTIVSSPYITLEELRTLVRPGRKMFLPDHVAQAIKDRELKIKATQAAEIAAVLERLIAELQLKLHNEGFEVRIGEENREERMPKRDRDRAEHLALLLALQTVALTDIDKLYEAEAHGREGIDWARMAGSNAVETRAWIALSYCYNTGRQPAKSEDALTCALEAARRQGDAHLIIYTLDELIGTLVSLDQRMRAEKLLAEAFEIAQEKLTEEQGRIFLPRLLLSKGRIAATKKEQGKAINAFREALHLSDMERDPLIHTSILSQLGTAYGGLGEHQKALECFSEMTRLAQMSGDAIPCAWGYFRIGELHTVMGEHGQAEKAFELSLQYSPEHYHLPRYYVYFKQSEICLNEQKIEHGIDLCNRILEADPETWSPSFAVAVYIHLGLLEERCSRFPEAENAFRHALDLCTRTEAIDRSANAKILLAKLLIKEGKEKEAETLAREVSVMELRTLSDEQLVADAYSLLSQMAEGEGEFHEALRYSRIENERKQGIARRQTEEALHKARIIAEVELLEREAQIERERRKRAEQELTQAILSLKLKNSMLEKVESQLHHILSGIVAEKAREITTSLKQMLEEIDAGASETTHPLNYIHGIDQEFFLRLRARWPGLTRKQERLCALIRTGLTTQEIASILNVSYEGVRALRKRLRKQLGIESEASLEGVIAEV